MGFRVSQEQEVVGVDLSLHAETAYEFGVGGHGGSFQPLHELITGKQGDEHGSGLGRRQEDRISNRQGKRGGMKLITAIVRPEKLEAIREGLEAYGVQGLTVSAASGYGRQRGYTEVYRGAEYNVDLLPKIRVEVLATDEQADDILDVIIASSNTGRAGDGKVWTMGWLRSSPGPHRGNAASAAIILPFGQTAAPLTSKERAGTWKGDLPALVAFAPPLTVSLGFDPVQTCRAGGPGVVRLQRRGAARPCLQDRLNNPPAVLGGVPADGQQRVAVEHSLQHFAVRKQFRGVQPGVEGGAVEAEDVSGAVHIDVQVQGVRSKTDPQPVGRVHSREAGGQMGNRTEMSATASLRFSLRAPCLSAG